MSLAALLSARSRRLAVLVGSAWLLAAGASQACELTPEWERIVGVPGVDVRLAGMALWGSRGLVLGGWLRPPEAASPEDFSIGFFRLSEAGEADTVATLNRLDSSKATVLEQGMLSALDDVAVLGGERLFGAAEANAGAAALVEVGPTGERRLARQLAVDSPSLFLRLLPLSGNRLLGLGQRGEAAMALILSPDGEIQRRFVDHLGPTAPYFDALEQPEGRLVLLANAGSYDLLLRGPSQVLLRRLGPDGAQLRQVALPGRFGALAELKDGRIAMVFDQSGTEAQDIHLELFDADLHLLWEKPVTTSGRGFSRYRVAALPDGRLLVAGAKESRRYLAAFEPTGEKVWEKWQEDDPNLGQEYVVAVRDRSVYVAGAHFVENGPGGFLQKIRVSKFLCVEAKPAAAKGTP